MKDLQTKYDELDNIVNTLDCLIDEITDKYYIDILRETKYEAQDELEELEKTLYDSEKSEMREMNIDYERSKL